MEEQKNYIVYMHIRKETDKNGIYKRYIGITGLNPKHRWNNGKGYGIKQPRFRNAIQKYGWDNFEHKILIHGLTKKQACRWEQKLIKHYNTNNIRFGYNMTEGGEHCKHSKETRKKISCNNANKHSAVCLETGKRFSSIIEIARALNVNKSSVSNVCRGDKKSVKGLTFRYYEDYLKLTQDDIKSILNKKNENKPTITPFKCLDTGEIFYRFKDAEQKLGIPAQTISKYCRGKLSKRTKQTKGLHFVFLDIDKGLI